MSRPYYGSTDSRQADAREDEELTLSLLEAYHEGDEEVLERIFDHYGRLLTHVVQRYVHSSGEPREDLFQVGYVGLLKAIRGYSSDSGAKFSSYAYSMIDGELRHHFRDTGLVKQPRWARSLYTKISEATTRLTGELGRPPLPGEVASEVNLTTEGMQEVLKLFSDTEVSSLDGSSEEIDLSAVKSVGHETFSLPVEDQILLEESLQALTELQRKVIYLFFYKDLSQTEIGRKLGLPQRKISRIISSSLKSLKDRLTDRH